MNLSCFNKTTNRALTIIEVMVIIVVVSLFFLFTLEDTDMRRKASRINCFYNLKSISSGFLLWSSDNNDKFPWEVVIAEGGAKGKPIQYQFLAISNELLTPKILTCNADCDGFYTTNWHDVEISPNKHISYFLSPDATLKYTINNGIPIVLGDRNLWNRPRVIKPYHINFSTLPYPRWDDQTHRFSGNISFVDSSVMHLGNSDLPELFRDIFTYNFTNKTLRIEYP